MKQKKPFSQKLNNILFFLLGILAVVIAGVIFINFQTNATGSEQKDYVVKDDTQAGETKKSNGLSSSVEKWQEGTITYNEKKYVYNTSIETYLLMGIDNDEPVSTAKDSVSGGQSDAIFLLVANKETQQMSIISINRNTMTPIEIYDENGKDLGEMTAQLCGQHGFGDGKKLSCSRTVNAVSKMFYNLPISGYMSINMGAIGDINDAIGGVEVNVLQDINVPAKDVDLKKGQTKTLNGNEAYCYLRNRDITQFESATDRLRRQEQYLNGFISKAQSQNQANSALAMDIYNSAADFLVTDIDFTELVSTLMGYGYSDDRMYTVPGETVKGDKYEEFNIDNQAFYDMVIQIFYKEADK